MRVCRGVKECLAAPQAGSWLALFADDCHPVRIALAAFTGVGRYELNGEGLDVAHGIDTGERFGVC